MAAADQDPAVLIDLLQAMVSQTHWVYAELWAPVGVRLMTQAVWWRKNKKHDSCVRLETLSRSMAVRSGVDMAGRVWQDGKLEWNEDLAVRGLEGSPRQDSIAAAGMAASLAAPVCLDGGACIGVVVLLSPRKELRDESMIERVQALCASAAPFLQHLNEKLLGDTDNPTNRQNSHTPVGSQESSTKASRIQIKYPGPMRHQFRAVNSDVAVPGVSTAKLIAQGSSPHRAPAPGPGHQRGTPLSYMTQLATALQMCKNHEPGCPDAIRTNVAWVVLEQLAWDVGQYSEVLTKLVDEMRPAIFSDDIITMNDGVALVKAPYFTQLAYREQQVREMEAHVLQVQAQAEAAGLQVKRIQDEADALRSQQHQLARKIRATERQLVKIKLSSFLERRVMETKVHEENAAEMHKLRSKISMLEAEIAKVMDSSRVELVGNSVEREYLHVSVRATGVLRPPMKVSLIDEPVLDDGVFGPWLVPQAQEEEARGLKMQMLILRNACLTEYEDKYALEHKQDQFSDVDRPAFVMQMDELEEEIAVLDDKLQAGGWNTPRYGFVTSDEDGGGKDKAPSAPKQNVVFMSTHIAFGSFVSRLENEGQDDGADEDEPDEEEMHYYTDKGSKHAVVNIWKGYEKRTRGKTRELPRSLQYTVVIGWVYEIFEEKVRQDIESQRSGNQHEYVNIERVFYNFLDVKYGSRHVANLVAYDFLKFIDANRSTVKLLHLFAVAMSGGWYDADWKYILRVQQFVKAFAPQGFPNLLAIDEFMVRYFYHDQPQSEINRVLKAFTVFPTYNMQLAQGHGDPAAEKVPAELFSEFVAYLLEIKEEPRVRKVMIMIGIQKLDQPVPVSYQEFEKFANMCVPLPLKVETCQLYYRMMMKAHPDQLFPPESLAMTITSIELELLMEHFSVESTHLFAQGNDNVVSLHVGIERIARAHGEGDKTADKGQHAQKAEGRRGSMLLQPAPAPEHGGNNGQGRRGSLPGGHVDGRRGSLTGGVNAIPSAGAAGMHNLQTPVQIFRGSLMPSAAPSQAPGSPKRTKSNHPPEGIDHQDQYTPFMRVAPPQASGMFAPRGGGTAGSGPKNSALPRGALNADSGARPREV